MGGTGQVVMMMMMLLVVVLFAVGLNVTSAAEVSLTSSQLHFSEFDRIR